MMARHSATLGSGAQARAGVIPLQSTASTEAPFSSSKRVTATMPCRDDRCSGLKHKHPLSVYHSTNCTLYLNQNTLGITLLPLTPSILTVHIMTINADGCSMRSYYLKYIHLFKLVQNFVRYVKKKKSTFHSACTIRYTENPALTDIHRLTTASINTCYNGE